MKPKGPTKPDTRYCVGCDAFRDFYPGDPLHLNADYYANLKPAVDYCRTCQPGKFPQPEPEQTALF